MSNTARLDLLDLDAPLERATVSDGKPLMLDPQTIRASHWANRHESSFRDADFEELKAEIESAGGNVQPIKVRPLEAAAGGVRYEVVFGHRRHRACLELGLKVAAFTEEVGDLQLWMQMERENRSRKDLSAWEQGITYQRALDAGMFPSALALSKAIGRSVGAVSGALAIANLPIEVIEAFASPSDVQFRYAKELRDAVVQAPEAVLAAAKALKATGPQPAAEVFKKLTEAAVSDFQPLKTAAGGTAAIATGGAIASTPNDFQPLKTATGDSARPPEGGRSDAARSDFQPLKTNEAVIPGDKGNGSTKGKVAASAIPERRAKISGKAVVFRTSGTNTVLEIDGALLPKEKWADFEEGIRKLLK